jgi:hypothetical protein
VKHLAILFALLTTFFCSDIAVSDVSVPETAKQQTVGLSLNRSALYLIGGVYLADTSGNTMLVRAPSLADDSYVFIFPSGDGSAGQVLTTSGSSAGTTWGFISNAQIADAAGIEYDKLSLTDSIVNSDIDSAADIARSKLADGTASHVVINDAFGGMSSEQYLDKTRGGAGADMSSVTFPSTGTITTNDGAATIQNKVIDSSNAVTLAGATVEDYVDFDEVEEPEPPSAGTIRVFAQDDHELYTVDSEEVIRPLRIHPSLIASPSTATCWSETGSVFTDPVTTVDAGDLPSAKEGSAIQLSATDSGAESTHYVSCTFTTDVSHSGYAGVTFLQRPGSGFAANEWTISVYDNGGARQALNTDVSGVTYLPNLNAPIDVWWAALPATTYTVRFARVSGSGSAELNVAKVEAGPGLPPNKGAASTGWQSFTSSVTGGTKASSTVNDSGYWRQNGQNLEATYLYRHTNNAGAAATAVLEWSLPSVCTPDVSLVGANTSLGRAKAIGIAFATDSGGQATGYVSMYNATTFALNLGDSDTNATFVSNSYKPITGGVVSYGWTISVPCIEFRNNVVALPTTNNMPVNISAHRNSTDQTGVNPNNSYVQVLFNSVAENSTSGRGRNVGGGYDTSTSSFVVPPGGTGIYSINVTVATTGTNILNSAYALGIFKGATFGTASEMIQCDRKVPAASEPIFLQCVETLKLNAGDRIFVAFFAAGNHSSSTVTLNGGATKSGWSITRLTDENFRPIPGVPFAQNGVVGGLVSPLGVKGSPGTQATDPYVGYYTFDEITSATSTTTADTWVNTDMALTLSPGVYLMGYQAAVVTVSTDANITVPSNLDVYDGSAQVSGSISYIENPANFSASQNMTFNVARTFVVAPTASTTYTVRVRSGRTATGTASDGVTTVFGPNISGSLTNPDNSARIWALRIF